ncbi:MAG: glycosyltransferase family 39 protein, partial [Clostridia bacterium]|nr:glycosyltransferase family 39 protein [Clostridia bacterium]
MLLQDAKTLMPHSKRTTLYMCLAAALVCLLYAGLTVTRGFPPTEGWYSYYAWLINEKGAIPYVDFELLFPPLYVYIIALFTRIFGYGLLALRIFGAVIYAATGVFACLIFEKLTKKPLFSLLAGLFAAAMLQSEAVQIFYDSIRFMDLAAWGSIYFLLCATEHIEKDRRFPLGLDPALIAGAVLAVAASMFKQSSGLIFLLYVFIFLLFAAIVLSHRRQYLTALGITLGVTALLYGIMVLHLATKGAVSAYLHYNFSAATAAKGGSIFAILFGWIGRSWRMLLLGLAGAALILTLLALCRFLSRRYPADEHQANWHPLVWLGLLIGCFTLLFAVMTLTFVPWRGVWINDGKMFTVFMVNALAFATAAIGFIVARIKKWTIPQGAPVFCFFTGAVFVLSYAVCTSGGLVESQIALGFPLVAMLFLPFLNFRKRQIATLALAVLMLLNTSIGFERKVRFMYSWWGLEVGSLAEQTESVSLPLLRGIRMNAAYAEMYENVAKTVADHTAPGDEIFAFPHI